MMKMMLMYFSDSFSFVCFTFIIWKVYYFMCNHFFPFIHNTFHVRDIFETFDFWSNFCSVNCIWHVPFIYMSYVNDLTLWLYSQKDNNIDFYLLFLFDKLINSVLRWWRHLKSGSFLCINTDSLCIFWGYENRINTKLREIIYTCINFITFIL